MILDQFAPVAEFNGYHTLLKAGVDMNKIASIEAFSGTDVFNIRVKTYDCVSICYTVSREYRVIEEKTLYKRRKMREDNGDRYRKACALFDALTGWKPVDA